MNTRSALVMALILTLMLVTSCSGSRRASQSSSEHLFSDVSSDLGGGEQDETSYDAPDEEVVEYNAQSFNSETTLEESDVSGSVQHRVASPPPVTSGGGTGLGIGAEAGGMVNPNQEPYDLVYYEDYGDNPFISTEDNNMSTFGMDVDTASYTIARRYILDGNLPAPASIRTEEFINYFDQDYDDPAGNDIFSITIEGAESEFGQPNYHLLRIGVKCRDASMTDRPAANMIFVVDVSGSMDREDRLEEVKRSLRMLAGNLMLGDRIGLVVYGSQGQVISEPTSNHDAILTAIDRLQPGGSTNANQGLQLAYEMAHREFDPERINRIILCSDGVANVGLTDADAILDQIKADAIDGITLTTIGFGMGNYNDVLLEKLANHGDGMYYYIDSQDEANRLFGDNAAQLLIVLASDAKIQVEFNAETVDRYRLIGYENRRLTAEQFRDDTVDAGEIGAGQSVTALYEIRVTDEGLENGSSGLGVVRIRYENLETREVEEHATTVRVTAVTNDFDDASPQFRFTAAVAEFAEILKGAIWAEDGQLSSALAVADGAAETGMEEEFCTLVETAIRLSDR